MSMNQNLATNLRRIRKMNHATLEEYAFNLGIGKTTLQEIEKGKTNTTLNTVDLIAQNLEIDSLSLLSNEDYSFKFQLAKSLLDVLETYCNLPESERRVAGDLFCRLLDCLAGEASKKEDSHAEKLAE